MHWKKIRCHMTDVRRLWKFFSEFSQRLLKNKRRVISHVACSDLFFFLSVLWPSFSILTSSVHVLISQSLKLRTKFGSKYLTHIKRESDELPNKTSCFHFIHAFKTQVSVVKDVQNVLLMNIYIERECNDLKMFKDFFL